MQQAVLSLDETTVVVRWDGYIDVLVEGVLMNSNPISGEHEFLMWKGEPEEA